MLLGAKRLWSAEIHLRFPIAPGFYRCGCLISCAVKAMSDLKAELKLIRQSRTSPAGSALQGGRAIFWCDAGELGKTGKADAALLRFSVAVKVMAAATRLLPEIKCALLVFISGKRFCARGTVAVAVGIRRPYISSASELRLRSSTAADQRSAAGPRPASCRWRRR